VLSTVADIPEEIEDYRDERWCREGTRQVESVVDAEQFIRIRRHDAPARPPQLRRPASHRPADRRAQVGVPLSDAVLVRDSDDRVRTRVLG